MTYDNADGRMRGRKLQARRLRVWQTDPHCAVCRSLTDITTGTARPFQLDHITALVNGGEDADDNCQVLCINCHDKKTQVDMGRKERQSFDSMGRVVW